MSNRFSAPEYALRLAEICGYLAKRKRWWLVPIIVFLLAFGLLMAIAEAPVLAPFIYTLF
jgi:hypothetical protein